MRAHTDVHVRNAARLPGINLMEIKAARALCVIAGADNIAREPASTFLIARELVFLFRPIAAAVAEGWLFYGCGVDILA